jgi:hypothetical protein
LAVFAQRTGRAEGPETVVYQKTFNETFNDFFNNRVCGAPLHSESEKLQRTGEG